MVSMASLNRSAEIALVFSRSSISVRTSRRSWRRSWRPDTGPLQRHGLSNSANALSWRLRELVCSEIDITSLGRIIGLTGGLGKAASLRAGRFCFCRDELLAVIPVPTELEADVGIRIGADIVAAGVIHVVAGREVLLLRCGQHARSGGEHESQCEGRLGEHGDVSCLSLSLTPTWCALASCSWEEGPVNQPDVLRLRAQKAAERRGSACLSQAFFVSRQRRRGDASVPGMKYCF